MRIESAAEGSLILLPDSLYCASSTVTVKNNLINFNNRDGSYWQNGKSRIGTKSFSIQGNVEAENIRYVEMEQSKIFANLYNRELLFYPEENGLFYRCILDGTVNVTYNQGYNIGRVFGINFTLLATSPYRYGELQTIKKFFVTPILGHTIIMPYQGNVPCIPDIKIIAKTNIIIKGKNTFMYQLYDKKVAPLIFTEDIRMDKGEQILITNGLPTFRNKLINTINKEFLFNPFCLRKSKEDEALNIAKWYILDAQTKSATDDYEVIVEYNPIFY